MKEAMLQDQVWIAPKTTIVQKETKKIADLESESGDRWKKYYEAGYSTGVRSASSPDRPPTTIFDERANEKAYYEMSEEHFSKLSLWNDVAAGNNLRRYTTMPKRKSDAAGLRVAKIINDPFAAAGD